MGILETVLSQLPQANAAKPAGKGDKHEAANPAALKPKAKADEKPAGEEKPASEKPEAEAAAEEEPEEEPASTGAKKTGKDYCPEFKERFGERA